MITEVLFEMLKREGKKALNKIEGCFAFAFADFQNEQVLLARDRFGINPLYYAELDNGILFSSEMRFISSIMKDRNLDKNALAEYFKLSYIPASKSILNKVYKLLPGHLVEINSDNYSIESYYDIPRNKLRSTSPKEAQNTLRQLLSKAVEKRLIADVPLGGFLSGGIDSSVISILATQLKPGFKTFSIGFKDAEYYDESHYAEKLAKQIGSDHKTISLSTEDLHSSAKELLDHFDEPFADSSAIAVNLLCKEVRKYVKVALSGDGADEIFSGYNKHQAEFLLLNKPFNKQLIKLLPDLFKGFSKSRSSKMGNLSRKLAKLKAGAQLSDNKRYIKWLCQLDLDVDRLLAKSNNSEIRFPELSIRDFNDILYYDSKIILPNDMLFKVDSCSMKHSLEVRTPFLDTEVVNFAFSLESKHKISKKRRKIILKESFKEELPPEIFNRSKKGFEIPIRQILLESLSNDLDELLNEKFIKEQSLFRYEYISHLIKKLRSDNPDNTGQQIWSLLVFQRFWQKQQSVD